MNKDKYILYIDTSGKDTSIVALLKNEQEVKKVIKKTQAQNTLLLIDNLLKESSLNLKDLSGVRVKTGPGSYIGLRIGVTVANTLSFILKIPVDGKMTQAFPKYDGS